MPNTGPLKGTKIIDCTHILSGAFASTLLGDLGAEVIKVERVGTGDPVRLSGPPFQNGEGAYSGWTCDFSIDYVKINADYRS